MKPIKFKEAALMVAEHQEEFITLPAYFGQLGEQPHETGLVTCFELSLEEIANINRYGKIWHTQLTGGHPMQPIMMFTANDFFRPDSDNEPPTVLDFEAMAEERFAWSVETFHDGNTVSALAHLKDEIKEVEAAPTDPVEYADCISLILEAAARSGVTCRDILIAFQEKIKINKGREWVRLDNGSYKHVKGGGEC